MSNQVVDDMDIFQETDNQNWRQHQMEDPITRLFLRAVTNKSKPDISRFEGSEAKALLKEFNRLVVRRGVLYRHTMETDQDKFQLVLPVSFREVALRGSHNDVGHLGRDRGMQILRDRFYWPRMNSDLEQWIKSCDRCLKRKTPVNRAGLVSIETSQPLELVCMDYLTLEMSKGGFQHILVITDHYTKYAIAVPTKNQTARVTADALFYNFIVHYGFPKRIHSDQGANFQSTVIKELCSLSGMEKSRTTPYHPMGNGITERMNKTLLDMLGTLDPARKHDWKAEVAPLVHAYNCTRHETTGYTPYSLMFGREPRLALDVILDLNSTDVHKKDYTKYVEDLRTRLRKSYELATTKSRASQRHQKDNYDLRIRGAIVQPGDRVLVRVVAFDGKHKIADRLENDTYIVVGQPNPDVPVYVVKKEDNSRVQRTLHRNLFLPIGFLSDHIPAVPENVTRHLPVLDKHKPDSASHSSSSDESDNDTSSDDDNHIHVVQTEHDESDTHSTDEDDESDPDTEAAADVPAPAVPISPVPAPRVPVRRPVPTPRRSTRTRRPPEWIRSEQYSMSQVPVSNAKADGVVKFISAIGHLMSQANTD
jgi:transposase InsO family protein